MPKKTLNARERWLRKAQPYLRRMVTKVAPISRRVVVYSNTMEFEDCRTAGSGKPITPTIAACCLHGDYARIDISPDYHKSALSALVSFLHELVHAAQNVQNPGHGREFQRIARAVGLTAPWGASPASSELQSALMKLSQRIGPYPPKEGP